MAEKADVTLLISPADEPARDTFCEAIRREGWRLATEGSRAACAVVVWSERSITSEELAASARPFLDRGVLLQVLLPNEGSTVGAPATIEPPDPFVYRQALVIIEPHDLDGSERAIDDFPFSISQGEQILAELARLGGLTRPRDGWNARISFNKPPTRFRAVRLVEFAPDDQRVMRRRTAMRREGGNEYFETAIGNRWQVQDAMSGDVLDEVEVRAAQVDVPLPQRRPWWKRVRRG